MKPLSQGILGIAALLGVALLFSVKRGDAPGRDPNHGADRPLVPELGARGAVVATNEITRNAAVQHIVAYYFHGTVRCETCLRIEQQAQAVMEQQFGVELATQQLRFQAVNYDLPEHKHFLSDYKLPCPSLVLVKQRYGKEENWKLLADTWQLVHEPFKLNAYVENEVRNFLNGAKQPAGTNPFALPPAAEAR